MTVYSELQNARIDAMADDLRALGLGDGDVVLARGSMRSMKGPAGTGEPGPNFLEALKRTVGETGTIMSLSFSQQEPFWAKTDHTFDRYSKTLNGYFPQMIIDDPAAVRGQHPTNSFVAIGPAAEALMEGHDTTATCFLPIRTLTEMGGKMMMVGCIHTGPGFSTIHLIQEEMGLANASPLSKFTGSHYIDENGERQWFARKDVPGCSMGFGKSYDAYREAGVCHEGPIVGADAMLVTLSDVYPIERAMLEDDPRSLLCDNKACISCGTRTYNKRALPALLMHLPIALWQAYEKIKHARKKDP